MLIVPLSIFAKKNNVVEGREKGWGTEAEPSAMDYLPYYPI